MEVRPHHYINSILPNGPVGRSGLLRKNDELLEVCFLNIILMFELYKTEIKLVNFLTRLMEYDYMVSAIPMFCLY